MNVKLVHIDADQISSVLTPKDHIHVKTYSALHITIRESRKLNEIFSIYLNSICTKYLEFKLFTNSMHNISPEPVTDVIIYRAMIKGNSYFGLKIVDISLLKLLKISVLS